MEPRRHIVVEMRRTYRHWEDELSETVTNGSFPTRSPRGPNAMRFVRVVGDADADDDDDEDDRYAVGPSARRSLRTIDSNWRGCFARVLALYATCNEAIWLDASSRARFY